MGVSIVIHDDVVLAKQIIIGLIDEMEIIAGTGESMIENASVSMIPTCKKREDMVKNKEGLERERREERTEKC